jgi:hypothetical protein
MVAVICNLYWLVGCWAFDAKQPATLYFFDALNQHYCLLVCHRAYSKPDANQQDIEADTISLQ